MNRPEESLKHLLTLIEPGGTDYVLGLHSFVRERIVEAIPRLHGSDSFLELISAYGAHLKARGCGTEDLRVLARIGSENAAAEEAARSSLPVDREEARAATHNFLVFCALCGVESSALDAFRTLRDGWADRRPAVSPDTPLDDARSEIIFAQTDMRKLLAQTDQWTRDRQRLAELEGEVIRLDAAPESDRETIDKQKEALEKKLAGYRDLDLYVRHVRRFSLYTRTRMDYERSVMKLTTEQSETLAAIRPDSDFLIRGGAGTGKTIVLLHALRGILRARESELELRPASRILFLTYTSTLVKYDRYVAGILREGAAPDLIMTADSLFQSKLNALGQSQRVDYTIVARIAERLNTTGFFSSAELAVELEDFLFGGLVSRREYVEEMIPRRGMRQPLSASQRAAVWDIRDKAAAEMEHDGILSRNFSRAKLIEHLEAHPDDGALRDLEVTLVDESQDLSAADLRALKLMTVRGLLMAGDAGQSIYGISSPYKRAGVDIAGRSRVLHTSFRNTLPIQELADAYRALCGPEEDGACARAFREGPIPELYTASTREELARLLLRKAALFIDQLGYDPENLTVLAPTKTDIATLGDLLGHAGYRHANIRDDDFSFSEEKTVRLSTLHSSKGLDFPVVLLYLPVLPPRGALDDRAGAARVRNLIYVAMTRAMDNLNVFTLEGAHEGQQEEPLQDLVRVMRAQSHPV